LGITALVSCVVVMCISTYHQAQTSSDLAALAAASEAMESMDDTHCCSSARLVAEANGATLTNCEVVRAGAEVASHVEVSVDPPWNVPGFPTKMTSTSYAGTPTSW
jgi:secretion/DNA translocation related TadE-like protein